MMLTKSARLWVLGAPIYIRFIVFPAGIMAWLTFRDQGTVLSQISAGLAMLSMVSFLFVSNPLLGGAGYRIISEWFGVGNLRQKAFTTARLFFFPASADDRAIYGPITGRPGLRGDVRSVHP